ncbi:hypothetical protein FJ364_05955 [Candidatus Dependentiae bacterium]|nr:hypothetical protein [Candidatus Dependentiae bacterium]
MCCGENNNEHLLHAHGSVENTKVLEHHTTMWHEILCHLPYAIFSVAVALIMLTLLSSVADMKISHRLFHSFHYLHILFAATGTILMFRKYSKSFMWSMLVGIFVPAVFCTVSDTILPFLGGKALNLPMQFHWCFISHMDAVLPFLLMGVLNGWVMSAHEASRQAFYSTGFHFFHIFISSMAAILYLVSFGFDQWWHHMGFVFGYIILVVLVPCTLADIVVPIVFAKIQNAGNHKH